MNIVDRFDIPRKEGEVGIEIELEFADLFIPRKELRYWDAEEDGSLRGASNEFVLKNPAPRGKVHDRLLALKRYLKDAEIKDSHRAGIHVHINMQEHTFREVAQFICLYLIFENMLVRWCGEDREGNLFCLRADDAPYLLNMLRRAFKDQDFWELNDNKFRYASMNVRSLCTYGSLEFRSMRSTTDFDQIEEWVRILLKLKDIAVQFDSPQEVVEQLSIHGTDRFYEYCLGDTPIEYNHQDIMGGVRNAQYVAYACTEWDEPEDEPLVKPRHRKWAQDVLNARDPLDIVVEGELRVPNIVRDWEEEDEDM